MLSRKLFFIAIVITFVISIFIYVSRSSYKTHFTQGNKLAKAGKYEQALSEYKKALNFPSSYDDNLLHNIASTYSILGKYEEAITTYNKILSIKPNDAKAYKMLAVAYAADAAKKKDLEELRRAFRCISKAFELAPSEMDERDRELFEFLKQQLNE